MRATNDDAPAGARTWRLPLRWRLGFSVLLVFLSLCGVVVAVVGSSGPAALDVLAALFLVGLVLAWRVWLVSVTLTADTLVIRNQFTIRHVPLANITGVMADRVGLRVIEAGTAEPTHGDTGTHAVARHAGGARRTVSAVRTGGAHWTGRRTEADEIADIIAAAAGLPPRPPRKPVLSRGQVRFTLIAGLVILGVGFVFGPLQGAGLGLPHALTWIGAGCWAVGAACLGNAITAAIDYRRTPDPPTRPTPRRGTRD